MTEAKRVTLTTISNTVSSSLLTAGSSGNFRFGADFLAQTEKSTASSSSTKGLTRTIRINVELFQTDSNKYPEFDYSKLLHLEKKKLKKLKQKSNGFSDPFEENDDDVTRIAKELEKKYGNAYSTGRSKNKRQDIDIGIGYDESDSFIDNTEAYDEMLPEEMETVRGGFYINSGSLEFKTLYKESYTTKTDELIKMPDRPRKRVVSSSSEESSSSGDDDEEDDSEDDDDEVSVEGSSVETSKSKSSASTNDKKSKSSTPNPAKKKTVATENGPTSKKTKEKNLTSGLSCSASSSPKMAAEDRASDVEKNAKKVEKTTTVKDMLKAQRDNFLKSQTTSSNGETKSKSSAEDEDDDDSSSEDSEDDDEDESDENSDSNQSATQTSKDKKQTSSTEDQGNEKLRTSDTKLPKLDPDVLSSIAEFKNGVKSQNLTGKKFQFDDKLSENFLKIDDSLLCLDKTQRSMVYAHLEFQLSLPKYYFLRKAKQLRIKEEKLKSKRTFSKLHKAVTETMSTVVASYEAELRRYAEQLANPNMEQPQPKMPKKKFPWNTILRNLLYDVYQVRWTSFPVLGTRKETLEEFITSYMRDKVVDIWPKGWMRYEELQKEIEKRKTAAKKAKERKKAVSATTSGQSSPNPNVTNNPMTSIQISNVSSLATASTTAATGTTTTAQASYIKQFEEFTSRSNANSDTESVASSSTSSGLKRKNTDSARNKPTKPKAPKLNGDQTKSTNNNNRNVPPIISVDLMSPNKRTDHSINHIMSPKEESASTSVVSSIFSATTAAVSQPSKHSTNTHVIDLDNYKSVGDILQTSKEIQAAVNAAAVTSLNALTKSAASRRESSGDSEIEIIGVFPAKQHNKKLKTNNRSTTPSSNYPNIEKTLSSSSSNNHHPYYHNNNNRKKGGNQGLTNLPGMDVNKMVNSLLEFGDELQIKPILTSTAQQQQTKSSSSSTQLSQGPGTHQ